MSAFPPQSWNFPLRPELILSGEPKDYLKYQEELVGRIVKVNSEISNGIYGESSSWTPVAQGGSTAGSGTYDVQAGHYVRWGNMVWFTMNLEWDDSNHTGTGDLQITGLPAAARNLTNAKVVIPLINMQSSAEWQGAGIMSPNSSVISVVQNGTTTVQINGADYTIHATGIYRAL